jgi:hypothetical protein
MEFKAIIPCTESDIFEQDAQSMQDFVLMIKANNKRELYEYYRSKIKEYHTACERFLEKGALNLLKYKTDGIDAYMAYKVDESEDKGKGKDKDKGEEEGEERKKTIKYTYQMTPGIYPLASPYLPNVTDEECKAAFAKFKDWDFQTELDQCDSLIRKAKDMQTESQAVQDIVRIYVKIAVHGCYGHDSYFLDPKAADYATDHLFAPNTPCVLYLSETGHFGINSWLYAFINGVLPASLPIKYSTADDDVLCPYDFLRHDIGHNSRILKKVRQERIAERMPYIKGLYQGVLDPVSWGLPKGYFKRWEQEMILMLMFNDIHENETKTYLFLFNIEKIKSPNYLPSLIADKYYNNSEFVFTFDHFKRMLYDYPLFPYFPGVFDISQKNTIPEPKNTELPQNGGWSLNSDQLRKMAFFILTKILFVHISTQYKIKSDAGSTIAPGTTATSITAVHSTDIITTPDPTTTTTTTTTAATLTPIVATTTTPTPTATTTTTLPTLAPIVATTTTTTLPTLNTTTTIVNVGTNTEKTDYPAKKVKQAIMKNF